MNQNEAICCQAWFHSGKGGELMGDLQFEVSRWMMESLRMGEKKEHRELISTELWGTKHCSELSCLSHHLKLPGMSKAQPDHRLHRLESELKVRQLLRSKETRIFVWRWWWLQGWTEEVKWWSGPSPADYAPEGAPYWNTGGAPEPGCWPLIFLL